MQQKFDVFVNFRGDDVRYNFLSHLLGALNQASLEIFVDKEITSGDDIYRALMSAIENSKLALAIFSPGYASSRWCLNELVKIIECRDNPEINQKVIPVFYHVTSDHVKGQENETSDDGKAKENKTSDDVKGKEKNIFAEAFERHERSKYPENRRNVPIWKAAMKKACERKGVSVKEKSPEYDAVIKIVDDVLKELGRPPIEKKDDSINSVKLIQTFEVQFKGKIWTPSSQGIHIENLDTLLNMLNLQAHPSEWNPQTNSTDSQAFTYWQTQGSKGMGSSGPETEWNPQTNSSDNQPSNYRLSEGSKNTGIASSSATEWKPRANSSYRKALTYGQSKGSKSTGTSSGSVHNISYPTTSDLYLPGARGEVAVFVTSSSIINETVEHCCAVVELLKNYGVFVNERDISISKHKKELEDVFKEKPVELPALFVNGDYTGGYEEIMEFNESGQLEKILQDYVLEYKKKTYANRTPPTDNCPWSHTKGVSSTDFGMVKPEGSEMDAKVSTMEWENQHLSNISSHLSGTEDAIVLYFTSSKLNIIIEDACQEARKIFRKLGVLVDERDIFAMPNYVKELKNMLNKSFSMPQVFIGGKYIGGANEIRRLDQTGELKSLVEGFPKAYCEDVALIKRHPNCRNRKGSECDDTGMIKCPDSEPDGNVSTEPRNYFRPKKSPDYDFSHYWY